MDLYKAIRIRAMKAVLDPDPQYTVRRVLRWYSKTFRTALADVEELPLEDVFQAYYEEMYEDMSPDHRDRERQELLITDEERSRMIAVEEAQEAELFEMGKVFAAEEAEKKRAASTKSGDQKIAEIQHHGTGPFKPRDLPESDLPVPAKIPAGISMTFLDEAEFEKELDGFGVMAQPKKP